jgi:hypothetical protein
MKRTKAQQLRPIDAPIFSYWQALFLAFYSNRLYIDVAKRWRGFGARYLLLLILVVTIPLGARLTYYFNHYFNDEIIGPLQQIPTLFIQNGEISMDKQMPYFIKNKAGKVVVTIDTTGVISNINQNPDLMLLVTKDNVFFRSPTIRIFNTPSMPQIQKKIYEQSLNKGSNEVFAVHEWMDSNHIERIKWIVDCLIYPLVAFFSYGLTLVSMVFFAFFGQLCSIMIFKHMISFKEACRICMVAATPQQTLFFLLTALDVTIPYSGIFYIALLSTYVSYAILSVRRESQRLVCQ